MKLFGHEITGFAKALVILAAVFLVASGLCGLQLFFDGNATGSMPVLFSLGLVELAAAILSAIGIVVVLLLWIGSALYRRIAGRVDADPTTLSASSHDSKHDDPE